MNGLPTMPPVDETSLPSEPLVTPRSEDVGDSSAQATGPKWDLPRFGLSKADHDRLISRMLGVVGRIGCHAHMDRMEVVHDAFIMALSKPISERPVFKNVEGFIAWMCTLAKFAALSNRKSKHRRPLCSGLSDIVFGALLRVSDHGEAVGAREAVRMAFAVLSPEEQDLVLQVALEEVTLSDVAREQGRPVSTTQDRYRRAMRRLRAVVTSLVVATMLFFTKNLRAAGARWSLRATRMLTHAAHATSPVAVTVACGAMLPTSSFPVMDHDASAASVQAAPPLVVTAPEISAEPHEPTPTSSATTAVVASVKPTDVDTGDNPCSAAPMKLTKTMNSLARGVLPCALVMVPAAMQAGCAGSEQEKPPPQVPQQEVRDDSQDPYESMCEVVEARGERCPSKKEWCRGIDCE